MATRAATSRKSGPAARKSTASKTAKPARATAKPAAPGPAAPNPGVATGLQPAAGRAELKKKELTDRVIERTGVRKKFAKPVVEAMIDILGEALAEGRELNLQPLGKVKQQRSKDTANARIVVAKIRQSKNSGPALDPQERADADKSKETVAEAAKGR